MQARVSVWTHLSRHESSCRVLHSPSAPLRSLSGLDGIRDENCAPGIMLEEKSEVESIFATNDTVEYKAVRGLNLPEPVLRKIYHANAVKWFPGIVDSEE